MPNTLGHLGLQALLTARMRADVRLDDLRWVALGCVLPDVPWIARRVVLGIVPGMDDASVRAYAIAQSSLALSLVLAAAVACLALHWRRAALLLSVNATLHLVLDAVQTKWGNGVLLAAPFDFSPINLGWFWPESPVTLAMTLCGVGVLALGLAAPPEPASRLFRVDALRLALAALLGAIWLLVPLLWMDDVVRADAHALQTLDARTRRAGRPAAFDRAPVRVDPEGRVWIEHAQGLPFSCTGACPEASGRYSLRGRFESQRRFRAEAWHRHRAGLRDAASYLGLLGVAALWLRGARGSSEPPPP